MSTVSVCCVLLRKQQTHIRSFFVLKTQYASPVSLHASCVTSAVLMCSMWITVMRFDTDNSNRTQSIDTGHRLRAQGTGIAQQ